VYGEQARKRARWHYRCAPSFLKAFGLSSEAGSVICPVKATHSEAEVRLPASRLLCSFPQQQWLRPTL